MFKAGIISVLVILQLMVPLIGSACNDFLTITAQNNQSFKTVNVSAQSCCKPDQLHDQGFVAHADEEDSAKQDCCNDNCNMCSLGCCSGSAIGLLRYSMNIFTPSETSIIPLGTPPYKFVIHHGIFRPPRA
jgi:hypothetical protein